METVYKITAYPINPAYRPRVVLVRDDDPVVAKKKAELKAIRFTDGNGKKCLHVYYN